MSEVKWVNEWYSRQDQVPVERIPGGALETVAVPILTLDDLEAWLKQQGKCDCPHADINSSQEYDRQHAWWCSVSRINHLLVQVQAMKEGR